MLIQNLIPLVLDLVIVSADWIFLHNFRHFLTVKTLNDFFVCFSTHKDPSEKSFL